MSSISQPAIELDGVRVHNLKNIDLRLPIGRLTVITGVSGSGKSSLAFDTLYAEGQRRYIECFSAYARQFLDRLEKPDADRIDNIPPAIAIRPNATNPGGKSTIGTATEIHNHFRLLFDKIGRVICPDCKIEVQPDSPRSVAESAMKFKIGHRLMICFPIDSDEYRGENENLAGHLQQEGFNRVIVGDRVITVDSSSDMLTSLTSEAWAVVDRLTAGNISPERLLDSLELAFRHGDDRCIFLEETDGRNGKDKRESMFLDERNWEVHRFSARLACNSCNREFVAPEPQLFNFNSPRGACPECHGFGQVPSISFEHLVPNPSVSLREGAIVAWTTPAYRQELDELLDLADDYEIPVDVPFSKLSPQHLQLIRDGVPDRNFGGLKGFFRRLEQQRDKMPVRVFLNRWRVDEACPECHGDRLQPLALAIKVADETIADISRMTVAEAMTFFGQIDSAICPRELSVIRVVLNAIRNRLRYLSDIGLDGLTLDRELRTLSAGEKSRVSLTAIMASDLVNTLYVFDEPSAGLHRSDSESVIAAIGRLRDMGNTVVVVEHDEEFMRAADELIDLGPGAGADGGRVVFQGPPQAVIDVLESETGAYLSGRKTIGIPTQNAEGKPSPETIRLVNGRLNNISNLTIDFPLGCLCVVTGVSGSGKSTLVEQILYPAVCQSLKQSCSVNAFGRFEEIHGCNHIDEVILIDSKSAGRTSRSNPVTSIKAFDEIRKTFADTHAAKLRGYSPGHFSFNSARGGRCSNCRGSGSIAIDLQFLPDVAMTCPDCKGNRYEADVLDIKYRGLSIAEVLAMTVREAFPFFRSQPAIQRKLQVLKNVGLDYLPLGQPATTLSGGESQRLKLASFLTQSSKHRTLFLIDQPTTGLHRADVACLLRCFQDLIAVGHSLIITEHHFDVIQSAGHLIDLGPGAGAKGGKLVAAGRPEEICNAKDSQTGRYLRELGLAVR